MKSLQDTYNVFAFFKKNKRILGSIALFFIIFLFLGLPYKNWGFDTDDCGILYRAHFKNIKNIFSYFLGMDLYSSVFPPNFPHQTYTFFSAFYRPIIMLFFGIQSFFLGNAPYSYFLVAMFFHALNVVLVFNIFFAVFASFFWAFLGALFFGVHISLASWLGWIAAQVYQIGLFFPLISIVFFWQYLKTRTLWTLVMSCLAYAVAVFTFEINIIFPIIIMVLCYAYKELRPSTVLHPIDYFKKSLGFWFMAFLFLIMRFINYPLLCISQKKVLPNIPATSTWQYIKIRFYDGITFFTELTNISFLPSGNKIVKGVGISLFLGVFLFLLFKNKHKSLNLLYIFCCGIYLWPSIMRYYTSRHFYFALPFFTIILITLIIDYDTNNLQTKAIIRKIGGICLMGIVIGNFFFLRASLSFTEKRTHGSTMACMSIIKNPALSDKMLCFIGIPQRPFRSALAQTLWFLGFNTSNTVVYDEDNLFDIPDNYYSNAFTISPVKNGYHLRSTDKNIWWPGDFSEKGSLGTRTVHSVDRKLSRTYEMTYIFDEKYRNPNIVFISWDCMTWQFKILPPMG